MSGHHTGRAPSAANPNSSTAQDTNQVAVWFQKFAPFVYDTSASTRSNFDRLASQRNWGDKLRRKQWTSLQAVSAASNHADADDDVHTDTPNQGGAWFQQFDNFVHDPTVGIRSNFERLAAQRSWGNRLKQRRWAECQEEEFGYAYGTNTTKLEIWQRLCREVLGSRNVLVNLMNLIDHRNIGVEVIRFKNYSKFRAYTTLQGNVFPLKKAKEDCFIRALLRKL
ncbi:uncharacterized protein J4E79_003426 [Alternaria viburni]|uniref:uncharacterized protein n=1 Tax=Alternaria viburni TaxID=566460 RepID=UPI0020C2861C|nr:uncharacterized protein J4E79_003426 [Alternaria viburni]KAI4665126.1 hypothetical protein J4E79_003426 [Alternaria viburni]